MSFYPKQIVLLFLAVSLSCLAVPASAPSVFTEAPGNVFFQGDQPVLQMSEPISGLSYTLMDWHGKVLERDAWPADGGAPLVLPTLPNGYYLLQLEGTDQDQPAISFNFTVIPSPNTPRTPCNPFFGVDSAQSWLATEGSFQCRWYDGDGFRLVSDLIAWAGFSHVRERMAWGIVNPTPEEFHYGVYRKNADLLHERGVFVSGMFHDAPKWTDNSQSVPHDLAGVFRSCRRFVQDFGECMEDWEFWNEEDIGFSSAPVWDYVASLKAASLGFKAGNPDIIVAPGALAMSIQSSFHEAMYLNDIAKYTDILNFHTYDPPTEYARIGKELRAFLAAHGIPNRAAWITECGTNLEGHSKTPGVMPQFMAHSPEQELLQAEFYPKSQLYHLMQGIARNYFFVFPPYNEAGGQKDWGAMRRDGSVKPVYAAMTTMLAQVGDASLLGELKIRDSLKAFLFERPDQSQVLVFWQLSKIDSHADPSAPEKFTLQLADGDYSLVDMLGTPNDFSMKGNGAKEFEATRYPTYLSGLHGLNAEIPPFPTGEIDRHALQDDGEDLTVVFRVDLNPDDFAVTGMKSEAELRSEEGRLKVTVWNLSEVAKTGVVQVQGGELIGCPSSITVAPMSKVEFDAVFRPAALAEGYGTHLVISGLFNGKETSRLDVPLKLIGLFFQQCQIVPLDWAKPSAWQRNTSASQYECVFDSEENALCFKVSWDSPVDRWFYPVHNLQFPKESFQNVIGIQFEVKTWQDKVENDFHCQYVMVGFNTPADPAIQVVNFIYSAPLVTWESRRILFDQLLPEDAKIQFLRIGCNPKGTKLTFWIRNITALFLEK